MSEYSPIFGGEADDTLVTPAEGRKLASIADTIARWTIFLSLLILPLLYLPGFSDILELPKQAFLAAAAVIGTLAWLGKMLALRRVEVRRSVVNLMLGVFIAVYAASAILSKNRYASLVGDFGQEKAGLATVLCFALLYFVAVNVLRDAKDVKKALSWMALGGLLVVAQSISQVIGFKVLPGAASRGAAFNTVGTTNAVGVYAAAAMTLAMGLLLMPARTEKLGAARKALLYVLLALGALYLASLYFWALWLMLMIGSVVLVAYGLFKNARDVRVTMLAVPMAAIVVAALFLLIRPPAALRLPAEVMPSLRASWAISREALAARPLLGSGPGTFLYDYAQFRSKDLNATSFWNVQFDRSSSRLLTMLGTLGLLGSAAFLVLAVFLAAHTAIKLWRGGDDWLVTLAAFGGWMALLVGKAFYSSNMTLEFAFWMLTAMLVALQWHRRSEMRLERSPRAALGLSFAFIVAVIFSLAGLYVQGQRLVAERHYYIGISADVTSQEGADRAARELHRAAQLNSRNDLYFRALSQALVVQANLAARAAGEAPNEEQARQITVLAANAVNAGRRATLLNPSHVQNWASLAGMYRDLGPAVEGALAAAKEAYKKASALEPNSPTHYVELAKIELAAAEDARGKLGTGKDLKEDQKAAYQKTLAEARKAAHEQLETALALKRDYAAAHYWTAVLLQSEGKGSEALAALETVRNANAKDLGVGFQLAILYYQNKQLDQAVAELRRVIGLEPRYANARWYLAAMLEEKGDLDGAIAQIGEILKADPQNEVARKRLDELNAKKAGNPGAPGEGLPEPVDSPAQP